MVPRSQSITTLQITNKYYNTVTCPKNQITCPAVTSLKSYQLKRQNRESNFKSFDYWADMHDRRHGLAQYQSAQCKEKCFEGNLTYAFNIRELLSMLFQHFFHLKDEVVAFRTKQQTLPTGHISFDTWNCILSWVTQIFSHDKCNQTQTNADIQHL
jgi:hypothetical protein